MLKRRKAELAAIQETLGQNIHRHRETRFAQEISITANLVGSSVISSINPLPLPPQPLQYRSSTAAPPKSETEEEDEGETSNKKTQRAEVLEAFQQEIPRFLDLILEHEFDQHIGNDCHLCTRPGAKRTTRCYDCNHPLSCSECFISAHRHNRTHWAEVWNEDPGFFVRNDISTLRPEGYAQHLGHGGDPCPMPDSEEDLLFFIVDVNGIHNTKLRFCHCPGADDRVGQLLRHRLFPATLERPKSAFTFQLLHNFHLHHLESKATKYDFMGALRRLTDNAFTNEVSDLYSQFRIVTQVWTVLTATKRLGQAHGIDDALPHRPKGTLIIYCPACPEPHFNMLPGWEKTPPEFRHLIQMQMTLDGNFHLNRYIKNTDPHDTSLFRGRAYIPDDQVYQDYVKKIVLATKADKYNCGHLEVLRKQNAVKKFKNMAVSGSANGQCGHVFVKSSVDLQMGERFANVDYAVAHALRQQTICGSADESQGTLDLLISYDISCAYSIHATERFSGTPYLRDVAKDIALARWLIPLVHVQNHKDNCTYLHSSAYTPNACHFHGETAEHFWPTGNQLGGQTRQMNSGHRHDTHIDHFGDWNFKKMVNLPNALYNDLIHAKKLYDIKCEIFKGLSKQYVDQIQNWNQTDRAWRTLEGNEVQSVYRHNQKNVPSESQIYQMLINELGSDSSPSLTDGTTTSQKSVAYFIHDGLLIRSAQLDVKAKLMFYKVENSEPLKAEIEGARLKLRTRIDRWRSVQKRIMPQVGDHVARQSTAGKTINKPEEERLFLPSDLSDEDRASIIPIIFSDIERKLLEGRAFDTLRDLRTIVKTLTNLYDEKGQNYGQVRQTRASARIQEVVSLRDSNINEYNSTRDALIKLGGIEEDDPILRHLTKQDTYQKRTNIKRTVGDTYRHDGLLWANRGVTSGTQQAHLPQSSTAGVLPSGISTIGTQGSKAKKRRHIAGRKMPKPKKRRTEKGMVTDGDKSDTEKKKKADRKEGWLWRIRPTSRLTEDELREWLEEGDRVQWFRAEAEMQRWQEEWEIKQVEFLRCIRYFEQMSITWNELATRSSGGKAAYAKKKSAMFHEMTTHARNLFMHAGYSDLLNLDGPALVNHFRKVRALPENIIPELEPGFVHDSSDDASATSEGSD
ncbi:hypothetical protein BDZ97DRAFT_1756333 [Flammula alnicola]|nr:hypothetical protein BDZ97DRAFT_1756333 [Flammula alnicola]